MATLFEVEIYGAFRGKSTISQLTFASDVDDVGTTNALALAQALGYQPGIPDTPADDSVLNAIILGQTSDYVMKELFVRSLYNVNDFVTFVLDTAGYTGAVVPAAFTKMVAFAAMKLRTNRVRTDIRRGTLALTPFPETSSSDGRVWDGAAITAMTDICTALNAPPHWPLVDPVTTYRPAVFSKMKYVTRVGTETKGPRWAYKYYPTEEEQFQHVAIGVTWSPVTVIRSQETWAKE